MTPLPPEPATTPTCGKCGRDLPERGCCPCIGRTPAADRVTALTLRCDDLREQRDEARAERDQALLTASVRQDTIDKLRRTAGVNESLIHINYKVQVDLRASAQLLLNDLTKVEAERDEARAQVVACQTAADDLRARLAALAAAEELLERIRIARVRDSSAPVDPCGEPSVDDLRRRLEALAASWDCGGLNYRPMAADQLRDALRGKP